MKHLMVLMEGMQRQNEKGNKSQRIQEKLLRENEESSHMVVESLCMTV